MPNDNIQIAKNIFIKYRGSHFHMKREGEYEFYKNLGASKEQEEFWAKEMHKDILTKIEYTNSVSSLVSKLSEISSSIAQFRDIDNLQLMLDIVESKSKIIDSFSKMRIAEEILGIVETFSNRGAKGDNIISHAKQLAIDILKDLIDKPITVDPSYNNIEYLKDVISEDNIIMRVKKLMQRYEVS